MRAGRTKPFGLVCYPFTAMYWISLVCYLILWYVSCSTQGIDVRVYINVDWSTSFFCMIWWPENWIYQSFCKKNRNVPGFSRGNLWSTDVFLMFKWGWVHRVHDSTTGTQVTAAVTGEWLDATMMMRNETLKDTEMVGVCRKFPTFSYIFLRMYVANTNLETSKCRCTKGSNFPTRSVVGE